MKKPIKYFWIICLWSLLFAGVAIAENMYVTGITKITMRTGPGTGHKIVMMLESGTKLKIMEYQKDWSRIRLIDGRIGWVLSRFLTQKIPDAIVVQKLEKQNQKLTAKVEKLEEENKNYTIQNARLVQTEEKYKRLKKASADFLKLEEKYTQVTQQFESQQDTIKALEKRLNSEPKFWYLIGPGVFIVGLFFGLSTGKKKRSSLI